MKNSHWSLVISHWVFLSIVYCLLSTSSFAQFTFTITPSITNVTCPGGNDGAASVLVSGGTSPYTYQWSEGQTVSSITGLYAGNYTLTITDNTGIDSTIVVPVSQPQPLADNPMISCLIILNPTGGTPPYSINWNDGSINFFINEGPGNYSVMITDANNCTTSFSYAVECFVAPSSYFTPNGDGFNDTWSIANAQYFDNARVIVFDRWGTRVWEHKGLYEPWDGKSYLGIPVPDAVYYYFFYQDKEDKQKQAKAGSITILR